MQPIDVIVATRRLWQEGVTRFVPTVITQSAARIERSLHAITIACAEDADVRASIIGIHLEGPYLSAVEGARGAHPLEHIRLPNWDEFACFQEAAQGRIRLVTLAPEAQGAVPLIERLRRAGVVVAIGHTMANAEQSN